jgi:hypothetical protein
MRSQAHHAEALDNHSTIGLEECRPDLIEEINCKVAPGAATLRQSGVY